MGEIAEMMLDGTMCQQCGEWLILDGSEPAGYPMSCDACGGAEYDAFVPLEQTSWSCTICLHGMRKEQRKKIRFKSEAALAQHVKVKHPPLKCADCEKVCVTAESLAQHRQMKHGIAP